ncbi:hypothetical protein [Streptomyces sp. NPDC005322]|uniref:hypothetical protein n=1 Tax=unclassified Streptomyces TaxID=2593676 RepID=UPI0033B6A449
MIGQRAWAAPGVVQGDDAAEVVLAVDRAVPARGPVGGQEPNGGLACAVADLEGEGAAQDEQAVAVEGEAGIRDT